MEVLAPRKVRCCFLVFLEMRFLPLVYQFISFFLGAGASKRIRRWALSAFPGLRISA